MNPLAWRAVDDAEDSGSDSDDAMVGGPLGAKRDQ